MADRTVNGVPVEEILRPYVFDPDGVEHIPGIKVGAPPLAIIEPDARWPEYFQAFKARILAQFESAGEGGGEDGNGVTVVSINHVGSTSVPGLPAKDVIDIDLVLSANSLAFEPFYVPRLEAAGFEFRLREPSWGEHRFFRGWEPMSCNLHVWGPRNPEVERHRIFRDWLRAHGDDRELYARVKRECAAMPSGEGPVMTEYTQRKGWVVKEILDRAFKDLGYLEGDGK